MLSRLCISGELYQSMLFLLGSWFHAARHGFWPLRYAQFILKLPVVKMKMADRKRKEMYFGEAFPTFKPPRKRLNSKKQYHA